VSGDGPRVRVATEGAVRTLWLARPEKRNALDPRMIAELKEAIRAADRDPEVRVIALRGEGADFCSGADLAALRDIADASVEENLADVDELAGLFTLIREVRRPVVALVRGRALAGGCGLATACDLIVAAGDARFGYPEVRVGFVPAMVMAILRRNVSEKRAFALIAMGDTLSAEEAERIGLVNRVIPAERFEDGARAYLEELADRDSTAVMLCKRLLYHVDGMGFEASIRAGADMNVLARMTESTRAGVARFLDRR
jgi:methylglutaconyl-CoA hydratase